MATYRNTNPEGDLFEKVRRYISGLGLYAKPAAGIPASDLATWVLPSAVTDYSVGGLGYTKNAGTVTEVKMNNATVPQTDGVVDLGAIQEKIDTDHKLSADLIVDGTTNKVINVKPDWNAASGTDAEILNKPTIPAAQIQSDWNQSDSTAKDYIKNKPNIAAQVQSDWNQTDSTANDYIKNKPTIPTESTVSGWGFTKNTGTVTSTGGTVAVNNIQVVSALPASPDANTLYLIPES